MILRALVLSQEGRRDCPLCATNIAWMRGERNPGFMDALMPLACLPVPIAGRNRIWRKMLIDSVRSDPEWMNCDYTQQPHGLDLLPHACRQQPASNAESRTCAAIGRRISRARRQPPR
jgi:hypothetical protein